MCFFRLFPFIKLEIVFATDNGFFFFWGLFFSPITGVNIISPSFIFVAGIVLHEICGILKRLQFGR